MGPGPLGDPGPSRHGRRFGLTRAKRTPKRDGAAEDEQVAPKGRKDGEQPKRTGAATRKM
eukprot:8554390-Karenia_brevis.AAC.1